MNEQEHEELAREIYDKLVAHLDEIKERMEQEKEKQL